MAKTRNLEAVFATERQKEEEAKSKRQSDTDEDWLAEAKKKEEEADKLAKVKEDAKSKRESKKKEESERRAKIREDLERIAKEKAETERIVVVKKEKLVRMAKETKETTDIVKEKEKSERIAKEKEKSEKITKEKKEISERITKEKEKYERITKEREEAVNKKKDSQRALKKQSEEGTNQSKPAISVKEKPAIPVIEKPAIPMKVKPAIPVIQKPPMPVKEKPAIPVIEKPAIPMKVKPAIPIEKPPMPVKEKPPIPVNAKAKGNEKSEAALALVIVGQPLEEERRNDDNVDPEAAGRYDFETAKIAEEFMEDEVPIRHDEYPESDDEGAGTTDSERGNPQFRRGDGSMYQGQTFYNGIQFKECVLDYVLSTGYNLRQYRWDRDKIGFKCVGSENCRFQVYASSLPKDPMWRIRILKKDHNCIPNGQCDMFMVPVIARLFVHKIREQVDYYLPMKIEELILEKWKICVSRVQCQAARSKALRWIEVEADHQFARLRDYAAEIEECNIGSTVVVDTIEEDGKDVFNRFYVCFEVLKKTWKQTCRPLIGVDGCFLKNKVKGQLLVAIGRDASNAIYPIAWSVVQVENKENWLWFVRMLKKDLDLGDGDGFICVSDRQKGLIRAVELELPKMEHRMCVRHIYTNLKKDHPSKLQMKPLIWNLAWSYNEAEFQQRLERIYCYDLGVYETVIKSNPRSWCRAFYKVGSCCEDVDNNSTESFNRTISKAREKPFVAMLEAVRRLAMVRIARRSAISHGHKGIITPYAAAFLAREHEQAALCRVNPSTNMQYEVQLQGNTYRVCLRKMTCSCCKFQICGIPCEHAYGVILYKKLNPEDYVCKWFRTDMWKLNYAEGLVPQRDQNFWPSTLGRDIYIPLTPAQPGRPKTNKVTKADKKRKRGVHESPTKKQPKQKKRNMHCGICGTPDHNCRTHAKWESSQGVGGTQENAIQVSSQVAED